MFGPSSNENRLLWRGILFVLWGSRRLTGHSLGTLEISCRKLLASHTSVTCRSRYIIVGRIIGIEATFHFYFSFHNLDARLTQYIHQLLQASKEDFFISLTIGISLTRAAPPSSTMAILSLKTLAPPP